MDSSALDTLAPATRALVERRSRVMGPAYRLHYAKPLHLVRGTGTRLFDADGVEYLDAYNNVASLGHGHPRVIEATVRQLTTLNTNTRYLQRNVVDYAEDLVSTHPALEVAMFTCTGSEANDLAMRMAREYTGGAGVIVSEYAYHGCTRDTASWSPSSGSKQNIPPEIRLVAPPDTFRGAAHLVAATFVENVEKQILSLESEGIPFAALIVDSLFSSDGVHPDSDAIAGAADIVHAHGGVLIADEVQAGFGRTGAALWGYQRSGFSPDIVTLGKAMGNGIPIAGVVARDDVAAAFGRRVPYFNTFGGESAPIAAAQAVLDVIREDKLMENALRQGQRIMRECKATLGSAGVTADVRGVGLYIAVEFVVDNTHKVPAPGDATYVVNAMRDAGVLVSSVGPYGNILKIRPALTLSGADVDWFMTAFNTSVKKLSNRK